MSIDIQEVCLGDADKYLDMHFIASPEILDIVTDGTTLLTRIRGTDEEGKLMQFDFTYDVLIGIAEQSKALMAMRLALHSDSDAFRSFTE